MNQDNSILFEDCDPWALLHTYRLGLMCSWGGVLSEMALLCFGPKKVHFLLLWPSDKKFPIFCTGFHETIFRLSPERLFHLLTHLRTFQIWLEMKTKVENLTKMSICHRTINHKKVWNVPLDVVMCPLQIINDIKPLSLTLHGVNAHFIHHPSNVKNYLIGHKSETTQSKKRKKSSLELHIFTPFCKFLGQNSKYPSLQKWGNFFDIWAISI